MALPAFLLPINSSLFQSCHFFIYIFIFIQPNLLTQPLSALFLGLLQIACSFRRLSFILFLFSSILPLPYSDSFFSVFCPAFCFPSGYFNRQICSFEFEKIVHYLPSIRLFLDFRIIVCTIWYLFATFRNYDYRLLYHLLESKWSLPWPKVQSFIESSLWRHIHSFLTQLLFGWIVFAHSFCNLFLRNSHSCARMSDSWKIHPVLNCEDSMRKRMMICPRSQLFKLFSFKRDIIYRFRFCPGHCSPPSMSFSIGIVRTEWNLERKLSASWPILKLACASTVNWRQSCSKIRS